MRRLAGRYLAASVFAAILIVTAAYLGTRSLRDSIDPRLVRADNEFAFDLFTKMIKGQRSKNIVFSPVSVAQSLQMTYNGAGGSTEKAMEKTMRLVGMSAEEVNHGNAALLTMLENRSHGVKLGIANSLWARKGVHLKPPFAVTGERFYGAEARTLDFNDPSSLSSINSWVKRNTGGRIGNVVQSVDPQNILMLVNAVFFKGQWSRQFDKKLTEDSDFYLSDGSKKTVPMMYRRGRYVRSVGDRPEMIRLPYGDGRTSMYIRLADRGLKTPMSSMNSEIWDSARREMQEIVDVDLFLPRFQIMCSTDMKEVLSALGMKVAFDQSRADLSGISSTPVWIGALQHTAMIEVDESGTEAAANTFEAVSGDDHTFLADRPFFFAIQDDRTGLILFMGWVADPTEGMKPSD